jgi:alpha-galactosidase
MQNRWYVLGALIVLGWIGAAESIPVRPDELQTAHQWVAAHFTPAQPAAANRTAALDSPLPPFSFVYAGQPSAALIEHWQVRRWSVEFPDRFEHVVVYQDPQTGLELRCAAIEYRKFPTVEWTLHFTNRGTNDTPILSEILPLDIQLNRPGSGDGPIVLHHWKGDDCSPDSYEHRQSRMEAGADLHFAPAGGRPTSQAFPYFNLAWPGGGLIAVASWPGQWAAQFSCARASEVRLRFGQERTHFRLHPDESVRTPLVVLQFWQDDIERAHNVWRRWMLDHNLRVPPILTSCSGGFFPGLKCNEADELRFIDAFAEANIGLDYWWMDAGWYPCGDGWPNVGTWSPDPDRFPRSLKPISNRAHTRGMGLVLWFEPERVTPGTWLYENHPEWLLGPQGGTRLLNLGNPNARAWLTDHVDAQIRQQGIDLYRQDFNIDPLPYWRANDAPDRQGITEIQHVTGYLDYWRELHRRHPGLVIDSCASGGRRNDIETLRLAVPLLRSDYQSFAGDPAFAPGNQGQTFGLSSWIPYYGQGVYYNDRHLLYSVRSSLSPAFGFCADVRQPGIDWTLVRRIAAQWRRVAPCLLGDFHPLTPGGLDPRVWIAWQFNRPEQGDGVVQAFRRDASDYETARFPLRDLDPNAHYRVTDLDHDDQPQLHRGRELIDRGLRVTLPTRPTSALLIYERLPANP